jgi:hypothetical protein
MSPAACLHCGAEGAHGLSSDWLITRLYWTDRAAWLRAVWTMGRTVAHDPDPEQRAAARTVIAMLYGLA